MATELARRRFTVDEYLRMGVAGILGEDDRVELIDGEILHMSPIGDSHVEAVNRCGRAYAGAWAAGRLTLSTQNPLRLDGSNDPLPDVALLRPGVEGAPRPGDVLLLIEVADSSLEYDRRTKLPLYARAGIPETWVLNLRDGALEVHRQPGPRNYASSRTYRPEQQVACEAFPDVVLRVAELLPSPELERDREPDQSQGRAADRARQRGWDLQR